MPYPTLEQVESADREQLAWWYRFLSSPGSSAIESDPLTFQVRRQSEQEILHRIVERFGECGGMTPEISKKIGWG